MIAIFAGRALRGEPLRVFGSGEQTRDYVYVEDVVRANLAALEGRPGVYNIGTGRETSVNELVAAFEEALGRALAVQHEAPRPGEVARIALQPAGRAGCSGGRRGWACARGSPGRWRVRRRVERWRGLQPPAGR